MWQKSLKSVNFGQSYSKNKSGRFLGHSVYVIGSPVVAQVSPPPSAPKVKSLALALYQVVAPISVSN